MSVSYATAFSGPFRAKVLYSVGSRRVSIQITGRSRAGYSRGECLEVDRSDIYDYHIQNYNATQYRGKEWEKDFPPEK